MATFIPNSFTSYTLTDKEQLFGEILNLEQKMVMQNKLAAIAEERIALVPEANNYASFIQQEAFLKGQLTMLQWLLDSSIAAEAQVAAESQTNQ